MSSQITQVTHCPQTRYPCLVLTVEAILPFTLTSNGSAPSGDRLPKSREEGRSKQGTDMSEHNCVNIQSFPYARAFSTPYCPLRTVAISCRTALTIIPQLLKDTFTPSPQTQPRKIMNLTSTCFHHAHHLIGKRDHPISPCIQTIYTFSDPLYSQTLFLFQLFSAPLYFLHLFIHVTPTKLPKHFISGTYIFLLFALLISLDSAQYNAVGTITPK